MNDISTPVEAAAEQRAARDAEDDEEADHDERHVRDVGQRLERASERVGSWGEIMGMGERASASTVTVTVDDDRPTAAAPFLPPEWWWWWWWFRSVQRERESERERATRPILR